MNEIRVNISALRATKKAIGEYARNMNNIVSHFSSECIPTGTWRDGDSLRFKRSVEQLPKTVNDLSTASVKLSSRIGKKIELVKENKTYRVW